MRKGASSNPSKASAVWIYSLIWHFVRAMKTTNGFLIKPSIISIRHTARLYTFDKPGAVCFTTTSNDIEYAMQQSALLDDIQLKGSIIILAVVLGLLSQILINSMLKGDQGLGAFLSDGKGYGKSQFRPYTKGKDPRKKDPLPWLKLPKFKYVEVAGQENDSIDLEKEMLRDIEMVAGSEKKEIQ